MIQDRDVQNLWDAVEEIRKKIEVMEGTEAGDTGEFAFVASATSNRKTFHLRGCKFTHGFMKATDGFREYRSHDEASKTAVYHAKLAGPDGPESRQDSVGLLTVPKQVPEPT